MAIVKHGISGTARVAGYIRDAIDRAPDLELVELLPPERPARGKLRRAAFDARWDLWRASREQEIDLLISPCNVGYGWGVPHLLWIQDTMPIRHPEWFDSAFAHYARLLFGISARRATRVATASRDAAASIESAWPGAAPIEVIHWPVDREPGSVRTRAQEPLLALNVSRTEPHKNHAAAIEAVAEARARTGYDLRLRLIGPAGREELRISELRRSLDPNSSWVERLSGVSHEELERSYAEASVLIHPAYDEGFGLPLLEAATRGLPVLHSGRGPMSEVITRGSVGGPGARLFVDPLIELIERPEVYERRSREVLADAAAHSRADFDAAVQNLVRKVGGRSPAAARVPG